MMKKTPKQSRSQFTFDSIVEAAQKVIKEKGITEFNTNKIAEVAGVSIGSLYQFFKNKDSILDELINRVLDHHLIKMEDWIRSTGEINDLKVLIKAWVMISFAELEKRGDLSRFIMEHVIRVVGFERFKKVDSKTIPRFIEELQRRNIKIRGKNPELTLSLAIQAFRVSLLNHFLDPTYPREEVIEETVELIYRYLSPAET